MKSVKKAELRLDGFRVMKSLIDSSYICVWAACSPLFESTFVTYKLHMLIIDTVSAERALRAILCKDTRSSVASVISAEGTSFGLE